jgi:hypothetical protein
MATSLPVSNENLSIKTRLNLLFNVKIPSLEEMNKIDVANLKVTYFNDKIIFLKFFFNFLQKDKIKSYNEFCILNWKLIIFDNMHVIWNLVSEDERKICLKKLVMFLLLKK